jgi:hypothetical protein
MPLEAVISGGGGGMAMTITLAGLGIGNANRVSGSDRVRTARLSCRRATAE